MERFREHHRRQEHSRRRLGIWICLGCEPPAGSCSERECVRIVSRKLQCWSRAVRRVGRGGQCDIQGHLAIHCSSSRVELSGRVLTSCISQRLPYCSQSLSAHPFC